MIAKHLSISVFALLMSALLLGQEYNLLDAQGRKQGPFRKYYADQVTALFYEGTFKDDKPVGEFKYYYRDGKLKSTMQYRDMGKVAYNETYDTKGRLMATGKYIEQKKDSLWTYYTSAGLVSSLENWDRGAKHGQELVYFEDGKIAEETNHEDGLRSGVWKQNYESGKPKLAGTFERDQLEGPITYYFPKGAIEIKGKFRNGLREGTWMYFNEDGSVRYQSVYRQGDLEKEKMENGTFNTYGTDNVILSTVTYKEGLRQGPFMEYHDDARFELREATDKLTGETYMKEVKMGNELKREGTYLNDELHGEVIYYDERGIITSREQYKNGVKQ